MKLYILILLISINFSYSQEGYVFKCYEVTTSPIDSNSKTVDIIDIKIKIDFISSRITLERFDRETNKYDSVVQYYSLKNTNEDGSHSYIVLDDLPKKVNAIYTFYPLEYRITALTKKDFYIFKYNNAEKYKD